MNNYPLFAQTIDLNLDLFKFKASGASTAGETISTIFMIVVLIGLGVLMGYIFNQRRRLRDLSEHREEGRLRLLMSEINLRDRDLALIVALAESDKPDDMVPIMESRDAFEKIIQKFQKAHPNGEELNQVNQLRQKLEFGFNNIRNPFNNTKMLSTGTRIQCRFKHPKGEVAFLTSVLGINEHYFIIRPPTAKGKPVSLSRLKSLQFRVSRENDGEYEFSTDILGQQPEGAKAVRMSHTSDISRMLFRNAERVEMDLPTQFYVIRQEYATNRALASLKAVESQYRVQGNIRDLSTGGALVTGDSKKVDLHDGDIIIFTLPDAQIREDMVAQVVGIMQKDENTLQFHLQFQGLKEINRLKLNRFTNRLKEKSQLPREPVSDAS